MTSISPLSTNLFVWVALDWGPLLWRAGRYDGLVVYINSWLSAPIPHFGVWPTTCKNNDILISLSFTLRKAACWQVRWPWKTLRAKQSYQQVSFSYALSSSECIGSIDNWIAVDRWQKQLHHLSSYQIKTIWYQSHFQTLSPACEAVSRQDVKISLYNWWEPHWLLSGIWSLMKLWWKFIEEYFFTHIVFYRQICCFFRFKFNLQLSFKLRAVPSLRWNLDFRKQMVKVVMSMGL